MPFRSRLRAPLIVAALVLLAAACSGGDDGGEAASDETTTTLATTTTAPPPVAPLTGVVLTDTTALGRPALVVKIDNADGSDSARPQAGLNEADVVYEEMVEGSVTRFAAIFHSAQAEGRVGPVRSARSTDIALFSPLNHPLFAWSGANATFAGMVRESPIVDIGVDTVPDVYSRDSGRRSPHNLFSTTEELFALAPDDAIAPQALFKYAPAGAPLPATAFPILSASIVYGGGPGSAPVEYRWDDAANVWLRFQRGTEHVDETGQQVAPENVVVQFANYVDTGITDVVGTPVLEAQLVGAGDVWVLTRGHLIKGTWAKADDSSPTQFFDEAGQPILLTPGQTWIAIPPTGTSDAGFEPAPTTTTAAPTTTR